MKYYTFYRESNDFTDILNDNSLKSSTCLKIQFHKRLIIGLRLATEDSVLGYLVLKYGDDMIKLSEKDYTPKPNVDYIPKKN